MDHGHLGSHALLDQVLRQVRRRDLVCVGRVGSGSGSRSGWGIAGLNAAICASLRLMAHWSQAVGSAFEVVLTGWDLEPDVQLVGEVLLQELLPALGWRHLRLGEGDESTLFSW